MFKDHRSDDRPMEDEYLTIAELGARLKLTPKTIKNKMALGIFQRGVHYFSPPGISPRFKWSAIKAWLENTEEQKTNNIPMRRGYVLAPALSELWKNEQD